MTLTRIDVPIDAAAALPERVRRILDDASSRIDQFVEKHKDDPAAGFVPSDYAMVFCALKALRGSGPAISIPGNSFCEWGSGIGVVACLASLVGFDSIGIEIDQRLVAASKQLARDYQLPVEFVQGSYVPDGHESEEDFDESHVMTLEQGRAAYEELGLDPEDFDCIFAYPWPGEDDVVTAIFDRYASRGTVLVTFHGQDGIMIRRKVR